MASTGNESGSSLSESELALIQKVQGWLRDNSAQWVTGPYDGTRIASKTELCDILAQYFTKDSALLIRINGPVDYRPLSGYVISVNTSGGAYIANSSTSKTVLAVNNIIELPKIIHVPREQEIDVIWVKDSRR